MKFLNRTKEPKSKARRIFTWGINLSLLLLASPLLAPQLLAFPHQRMIGDTTVYSEQLISPNMENILKRSDALLRKSAIYSDSYGRHIFLTQDGWRWNWLALSMRGSVGLTRPFSPHAVVLNVADIERDLTPSRSSIGKPRSISGTIAHERTHQLVRGHFGALKSFGFPAWKEEGYCDYVAQETTLSTDDVALLKKEGKDHPAIIYAEGRQRVARILAKNDGSVDQLFGKY
jgi:hypothetical protein